MITLFNHLKGFDQADFQITPADCACVHVDCIVLLQKISIPHTDRFFSLNLHPSGYFAFETPSPWNFC